MKLRVSIAALCGVAVSAFTMPACAAEGTDSERLTAWEASRAHEEEDGKIVTGVARARDRLDSATSTSSLQEKDIVKIAPTSIADLFRNIPGIRSEAGTGTTNGSYTIRGLPLVSTGAKYLQFQEDGLPVLEFGDIFNVTPDLFIRADLNIAQVESIRGGSASTFASNAPGGVINLISKTGEVEGGSVMASAGLNYDNFRTDFDYGGHLSDTLRFHVGGFYREGEGPRQAGYTAERGGQIKFNVTKEFTGGHVRVYGKFLDDYTPLFGGTLVSVTGTDSDPKYKSLPSFSATGGSALSRYIASFPKMDGNNQLSRIDLHDGAHAVAKTLGLEASFSIDEWSITERMRYARQSGNENLIFPYAALPAAFAAPALGAAGGSLVYASGPLAGQAISDPAALNGNGLLSYSNAPTLNIRSVDNFTNDLRIGKVWDTGAGALTGTVGLYTARQELQTDFAWVTFLQDVNGSGRSALIDIVKSDGTPLTVDGAHMFGGGIPGSHTSQDVSYTVVAPYGSVNLRMGKLALGASVRVDTGKVEGTVRTNSPTDVVILDVNGDGVIADAERTFPVTPFSSDMPVNYRYRYVSYSGSVNYRVSDVLSTFARYSRGARAGADRLLLSPAISTTDGSLLEKRAAYDPVKQAEVGLKYRDKGVFLNVTGFWAKVTETNQQAKPDASGQVVLALVNPSYRAFGAEVEGGVRRGPFSLTASATVTNAKITASDDPTLVGNKPRHQAALIYQLMPQYDTDLFTLGADIVGTTSSYTQDTNQLKMPGFTTVNLFLQVRPLPRVEVSLNANNVFNVLGLTDVSAATMPAGGVTTAKSLYGRTISTSVRFYF